MKNKKTYFAISFIFFACVINAQESDTTQANYPFSGENTFSSEGKSTAIIIDYGSSQISRNNLNDSFAKPNLIELKLGYIERHLVSATENIYSNELRNLFIGNISTRLSGNSDLSGLKTNTWRFGINRTQGYGYSFGTSGLTLNSEYSFVWSSIQFLNMPADSAGKKIENLYNKQFKFGTSSEANIQFDFTKNIGINAGYERAIVFERHLVLKWLGSEVIEFAATFAMDNFIQDFIDRAPAVAPIVNFLLKNGLYYGLYELRREKMNWPFQSAPPIVFDQFKFGMTFSF
jgi:hypothetical protein